ncbi:hypothetical protein LR48_Vigan05g063000 [Vigna angularis]|uniref:Putative plant transposon protein domain-containing protein n=1 Tax=Phaseolus angularis TaxID=3914 RepID=A0A0L9UK21_PHAAN|nr:hypothetical protein LR48_Vigan05g063000 [Vigna angularis]
MASASGSKRVKMTIRQSSRDSDIPFMSYVRGKRIPYDADTINSFLETEWNGGDTLCQYAQLLEEDVDYQAIERVICRLGGTFRRNRQGQPVHIRRSDLTPLSKMWMTLMLSNISPCSHVSNLTYCIPDVDGPFAPPPPLPAHQCARPLAATQPDLLPYLTFIHRGQLATSRMLRELTCAMHELNMISAAEFDEYVAWPGDHSHPTWGGGAATDDDIDEDEQEEEDDDSEESDDSVS